MESGRLQRMQRELRGTYDDLRTARARLSDKLRSAKARQNSCNRGADDGAKDELAEDTSGWEAEVKRSEEDCDKCDGFDSTRRNVSLHFEKSVASCDGGRVEGIEQAPKVRLLMAEELGNAPECLLAAGAAAGVMGEALRLRLSQRQDRLPLQGVAPTPRGAPQLSSSATETLAAAAAPAAGEVYRSEGEEPETVLAAKRSCQSPPPEEVSSNATACGAGGDADCRDGRSASEASFAADQKLRLLQQLAAQDLEIAALREALAASSAASASGSGLGGGSACEGDEAAERANGLAVMSANSRATDNGLTPSASRSPSGDASPVKGSSLTAAEPSSSVHQVAPSAAVPNGLTTAREAPPHVADVPAMREMSGGFGGDPGGQTSRLPWTAKPMSRSSSPVRERSNMLTVAAGSPNRGELAALPARSVTPTGGRGCCCGGGGCVGGCGGLSIRPSPSDMLRRGMFPMPGGSRGSSTEAEPRGLLSPRRSPSAGGSFGAHRPLPSSVDSIWSGTTSASNSVVCTPASLTRAAFARAKGPGSYILIDGEGSPRLIPEEVRQEREPLAPVISVSASTAGTVSEDTPRQRRAGEEDVEESNEMEQPHGASLQAGKALGLCSLPVEGGSGSSAATASATTATTAAVDIGAEAVDTSAAATFFPPQSNSALTFAPTPRVASPIRRSSSAPFVAASPLRSEMESSPASTAPPPEFMPLAAAMAQRGVELSPASTALPAELAAALAAAVPLPGVEAASAAAAAEAIAAVTDGVTPRMRRVCDLEELVARTTRQRQRVTSDVRRQLEELEEIVAQVRDDRVLKRSATARLMKDMPPSARTTTWGAVQGGGVGPLLRQWSEPRVAPAAVQLHAGGTATTVGVSGCSAATVANATANARTMVAPAYSFRGAGAPPPLATERGIPKPLVAPAASYIHPRQMSPPPRQARVFVAQPVGGGCGGAVGFGACGGARSVHSLAGACGVSGTGVPCGGTIAATGATTTQTGSGVPMQPFFGAVASRVGASPPVVQPGGRVGGGGTALQMHSRGNSPQRATHCAALGGLDSRLSSRRP
eukprot:TRINITY_DN14347_c0_g1_i1.p1 TRINITY_DN14347_c0_g1~~TRINITY_DN14347_c0_g1_i1.p1  ORF type:complete len:1056 (+),score=198.18 TRINITY_DN14347_c0_g1_i1:217-3384(+)